MNRTALVPVAFLALCTVPLATASAWTLPLFLVPLAVALWVLRSGVDISDGGLTIQSLAGSRTVPWGEVAGIRVAERGALWLVTTGGTEVRMRSEEHTSELQSRQYLVCRLLLEKKTFRYAIPLT